MRREKPRVTARKVALNILALGAKPEMAEDFAELKADAEMETPNLDVLLTCVERSRPEEGKPASDVKNVAANA